MISDKIKLRQCTKEDTLWMSKLTNGKHVPHEDYYPNSLCVADKSTLNLHNTWYDSKYSNFYISIEACNPATYKGTDNGGKCKSDIEKELKPFLESNLFYYVTSETFVNKDMYED